MNLDGLRRGFREAEQIANRSTAGISDALKKAGDNAQFIEKGLDTVSDAFNRSEEDGLRALAELSDASTEAGRDIRKAFEGTGKSVDEVEKEISRLVSEIRNFAQAKNDVQKISNELKDLEKAAEDAEKEIDGISFQNAINGIKEFGQKVEEFSGFFKEAGEASRDLRRDIKLAFSDPGDAQKYTKAIEDLRDEYGDLLKDTENLGKSVKRLDTLNAASVPNLERIAKLALDTGKDFDDAADDIGEFLAAIDSGNADFAILGETLRSNFGIAAEALKQYGAEVDLNGKLIANTRAQQEKAQNALKRYIDESERFNDIATRNKDAQAKLSDEADKFGRAVGEQIDVFKEFVAEALLPVLEGINSLSPGFKKLVAGAAIVAPAITGAAVAGANAAAVYTALSGKSLPALNVANIKSAVSTKALTSALRTAGSRVAAFVTGIGGLITITAVAVISYKRLYDAVSDAADAMEQADKAQTSLLQTESLAVRRNKELLAIRRRLVEELKAEATQIEDLGKRRARASEIVLSAELALREAERAGGDTSAAKERLRQARELRREVDVLRQAEAKAEQDSAKAAEDRFKRARDAYQKFKVDYDNGVFDSEKKALSSLEAISGRLGKPDPEVEKNLKDLRGRILQSELDLLNKRVQAEEVTAEQSQRILENLLTRYRANTDQRKAAEESLSGSIQQILEQRLATAKQYADKELALQRSALQQRRALAEGDSQELQSLERRLAKGEDVVAQIKAQTREQNEKLKAIIAEEAALERAAIAREKASAVKADPSNADTIARQAAEQIRQVNAAEAAEKAKLDRALADESRKLDEQNAKRKVEQEKELASLQLKRFEAEQAAAVAVFEERRKALDLEDRQGSDTTQKRLDLEKEIAAFRRKESAERLKLVTQEIKAQQEAANVGVSGTQKRLNDERALLAIQEAQTTEKQKLQALNDSELAKEQQRTDAIKEQLQLLKDQNNERAKANGFEIKSSFGTVSSDASGFGEGFGQSSQKQPKEQQGPTEEELTRRLTQQRIKEVEALERSGRGSPNRGTELTRQVNEAARATPEAQFSTALTETNQLLRQIVTETQSANQLASRRTQASNAPPDNFADRNLTRGTERTL